MGIGQSLVKCVPFLCPLSVGVNRGLGPPEQPVEFGDRIRVIPSLDLRVYGLVVEILHGLDLGFDGGWRVHQSLGSGNLGIDIGTPLLVVGDLAEVAFRRSGNHLAQLGVQRSQGHQLRLVVGRLSERINGFGKLERLTEECVHRSALLALESFGCAELGLGGLVQQKVVFPRLDGPDADA